MRKYRLLWLVDGTYTTSNGVVVEDTKERWLEFFGCFMSPYYSISEFEFVEVTDETTRM